MPRIPRGEFAGYCYHVLNRGNGRARVFHTDADYRAFIQLLALAKHRFAVSVLATWPSPGPCEEPSDSGTVRFVEVLPPGRMNVRITSKGQVTIPVEIRERLGLLPNSEVEFEIEGNAVRIRKARGRRTGARGRSIVEHLRGKATSGMSTDEIMALTRS